MDIDMPRIYTMHMEVCSCQGPKHREMLARLCGKVMVLVLKPDIPENVAPHTQPMQNANFEKLAASSLMKHTKSNIEAYRSWP